jgi:hypothetical protein
MSTSSDYSDNPTNGLCGERTHRVYSYSTTIGGTMTTLSTNLLLYVRRLVEREEGQDLVEYALVVALIAFGADYEHELPCIRP